MIGWKPQCNPNDSWKHRGQPFTSRKPVSMGPVYEKIDSAGDFHLDFHIFGLGKLCPFQEVVCHNSPQPIEALTHHIWQVRNGLELVRNGSEQPLSYDRLARLDLGPSRLTSRLEPGQWHYHNLARPRSSSSWYQHVVCEACKALMNFVRTISAKKVEEEDVEYKNKVVLEFKKCKMEKQVESDS